MESAGWTQELLAWLRVNPGWGAAIVFAVSFVESLALVGILVPGIVILFGIGSLVGLGVLEITPVWIAASAGAFLGDSCSYALGYRYREHLLERWPFSRYPALMERGAGFFERNGTMSIVAGRFIGPLRPIIPVVVGVLGMKPGRFLPVDLAAAIAWAPSFLLPGILFGASLEIASEYTGRLTVLLVIALLGLWLTWWLVRLLYEPIASRSARWLRHAIHWTRKHPVLGRLAGPVLDPEQPEVLSVTALGILLVISFWALAVLQFLAPPFSAQPRGLDQAVADLALSLRNHLADLAMVTITLLSHWQVMLLASGAVLLWLLIMRRFQAALHWLLAVGGGSLLQLLLGWTLRATPQVVELSAERLRGPSSAMSLATVVLVFFAVMIAREVRRKHRQWPYLAAGLVLMLLALARLYLGLEWLSGALTGVLLGLAWTLIVGIAYRQRALRPFSGAAAGCIFYGSLALLLTWQANVRLANELDALQTVRAPRELGAEAWWTGEWRSLPEERSRMPSVASRRFQAQVAAAPGRVATLLRPHGWEPVPIADWRWVVQALNPEPDSRSLPLLGRAFEGRTEEMLLRREGPQPGQVTTLRLWDSGVRLEPGGQPVYLAQITAEQLVQRLGFFSYWRAAPAPAGELERISQALVDLESKWVPGGIVLLRQP